MNRCVGGRIPDVTGRIQKPRNGTATGAAAHGASEFRTPIVGRPGKDPTRKHDVWGTHRQRQSEIMRRRGFSRACGAGRKPGVAKLLWLLLLLRLGGL